VPAVLWLGGAFEREGGVRGWVGGRERVAVLGEGVDVEGFGVGFVGTHVVDDEVFVPFVVGEGGAEALESAEGGIGGGREAGGRFSDHPWSLALYLKILVDVSCFLVGNRF